MDDLSWCRTLDGVLRTGVVTTSRGEEVLEEAFVVVAVTGGGVQRPAAEAAAR